MKYVFLRIVIVGGHPDVTGVLWIKHLPHCQMQVTFKGKQN